MSPSPPLSQCDREVFDRVETSTGKQSGLRKRRGRQRVALVVRRSQRKRGRRSVSGRPRSSPHQSRLLDCVVGTSRRRATAFKHGGDPFDVVVIVKQQQQQQQTLLLVPRGGLVLSTNVEGRGRAHGTLWFTRRFVPGSRFVVLRSRLVFHAEAVRQICAGAIKIVSEGLVNYILAEEH